MERKEGGLSVETMEGMKDGRKTGRLKVGWWNPAGDMDKFGRVSVSTLYMYKHLDSRLLSHQVHRGA